MNNLLVAQSGGPTAAINATLAGVLQGIQVTNQIDKVYGAKHGINGVISDELIDLSKVAKNLDALELLKNTPASALGSCRHKLSNWKDDDSEYKKIYEIFTKYHIKYFIYIGGNDSMDTVYKLNEYFKFNNYDIRVVGAPKTIDNDLNLTDHCPGFGSAAKYIATTIAEIKKDIDVYDLPAVTIVEIMGRNAGWLTAASALSRLNGAEGPDLIYLCEKEFSNERFIADVKEVMKKKKNVLVTLSEGIKYSDGSYVSDQNSSGEVDSFGHKYIAGAGKVLEYLVRKEIGCKVRSVEFNIMQRAASHVASLTDIKESCMLGEKALRCALDGESGMMAAIQRVSNNPYSVEYISVPVEQVANHEKKVPIEWISPSGNDVTEELITYMKPLIQGELQHRYENGIPKHISLF
ncbi:MAG: 6-phosphofructokinase [Clostridiales bacterium]|nr:6-phosphofructokinase [Clostridiales bacterium]